MTSHRRLVTFEWALKCLLRSKANFRVLEGFLSELLHDDIEIVELLESEGNKESREDKFNRVDLLVKDRLGRQIIIEVQYTREDDYFQRMLYGTAKILTESLSEGAPYREIARVVSINIIHFDLGHGEDYLYEGRTEFRGVHCHDHLRLTADQRRLFQTKSVENIFPEYYILKVNNFNDVARDGLDEWIYFLKNGRIQPGFQGRGLQEAQSVMDLLKLSPAEKEAYDAYIREQRIRIGEAESTILRAEQAEARANEVEAKAAEDVARAEAKAAKAAEDVARAEAKAAKAAEDVARAETKAEAAEIHLNQAMRALIASGMPEVEARKILGLDR